MKIIDKKLLQAFSGAGICEWCQKCVRNRDPHHVAYRGMGAGNRLDIAINLVSLCSTFAGGDNCHAAHHAGKRPLREDLLAVVAAREGLQQNEILAEINRLKRLPKGSSL